MSMHTKLSELVRAFANAMNLISPEVQSHHEKVAYLAYELGRELDFTEQEKAIAFYGAMLHDIGSVLEEGQVSLHEIEGNPMKLAKAGAMILGKMPFTRGLAEAVSESQSPWQKIRNTASSFGHKRLLPQVIHMADTVSLLIGENEPVLNQIPHIKDCVHSAGEHEFHTEVTAAFDRICEREAVWMNVLYRPGAIMEHMPQDRTLGVDDILTMTEFMSYIIDFRSPFTAMHSAGVAASAELLAEYSGMSRTECKQMRIAGQLHDIGKLKIPKEILEKPGRLTDEEFNIIKEHAYYTYIILKDISGFEQIVEWAALHHEKLSGNGYPFRLKQEEIPLGSRIMAVADVFSAITEDRPYRKGMSREKVVEVLRGDVEHGALSAPVVELLLSHYDVINERRERASKAASRRYQEMLREGAE